MGAEPGRAAGLEPDPGLHAFFPAVDFFIFIHARELSRGRAFRYRRCGKAGLFAVQRPIAAALAVAATES
jgi:hypothetical protein